jgi:acetoacetate decarboxylase
MGREIWGFGKKIAHRIELNRLGTGEVEAVVELHEGFIAARAIVRPERNEPASTLEELPLAVLKVIPDVEGGPEPALAQLNSVLFTGVPHKGADGKDELYSGPARLEVSQLSDVNLPVGQIVDAKYMRMTADLPYGKILKTY